MNRKYYHIHVELDVSESARKHNLFSDLSWIGMKVIVSRYKGCQDLQLGKSKLPYNLIKQIEIGWTSTPIDSFKPVLDSKWKEDLNRLNDGFAGFILPPAYHAHELHRFASIVTDEQLRHTASNAIANFVFRRPWWSVVTVVGTILTSTAYWISRSSK